ncbi:hypothetical protein OCU04_005585 [Sclerotinia nivalis]|uniref:Uncharacterized protein n=1 Tax=Sclerotinia nivalis TaxID=352851 RepID=A0A9X0DKN9_9HELO|nr:hypothetical protein OCU04_005585 [Sclerotinia nivalis]
MLPRQKFLRTNCESSSQEHHLWDMSNLVGVTTVKNFDGLDLWSDSYINDLLQGAYNSKINVSKVVIWMQNPTQLVRYKAGRSLYSYIDRLKKRLVHIMASSKW